MGLSRRAYAAHRGCSESAVRKAIATGRIVTEADGTIDAARADAMWDARTDPAQQRGAHARATAAETAATTATAKAALNKPVPRAALDAVKDTLREAGNELSMVRKPNRVACGSRVGIAPTPSEWIATHAVINVFSYTGTHVDLRKVHN